MSTALRIASVTQVLKDLLNQGLDDHDLTGFIGGNIAVMAWPPDKIDTAIGKEASQLNIFMYQASPNQGWRNVAQPSFNFKGERIANPPLVLDLHYLLTAFGSGELHTDILLGFGMQILHERPVLDKKTIRKIMDESVGGSSSLKLLSDSGLVDQAEQITITPLVLSIEDISKLWAAFGTKYRPTAAYKVTVVLIESDKSFKPGLPVKQRNIYVNPFKEPVIDEIGSQVSANAPVLKNQKIRTGQRLVLIGKQLMHEAVAVLIDGIAVDSIAGSLLVSDEQVSISLLPSISAGPHQVQVAHPQLMGSLPVPHHGVVSKPATFMLSPQVVSTTVSNITHSGAGLLFADVGLKTIPSINPGQKVALLLNEVTNSLVVHSYHFPLSAAALQSPPEPTDDIVIPVAGVAPGNYLLRISVDGAESPLGTDAQGRYSSPDIDFS